MAIVVRLQHHHIHLILNLQNENKNKMLNWLSFLSENDDSKDYLTAYRDAGNEKELRKRNGGTPSGTLTALPFQMEGRFIKTDRKHRFLPLRREKSRYASLT